MIEDALHLFVQFPRRLVQLNRERHVRLAGTVFPHVLRLFVKASVDRIILVPSDQTSRPGVLSIRKPCFNARYVLLDDLTGPRVLVPLAMSIHLKSVPDEFASHARVGL